MQFTINFKQYNDLWEGLERHFGEYVVRSIESIMGNVAAPMHEAEALALYKVDGSVVKRLDFTQHFNIKAGYMHATLCTGDAPDDMAIRITAHDADHNPCMYDDAEYLLVAITDFDAYTAESVNPMAIRITAYDADHNPCMYDDAEYLLVAITDFDAYTAESVNPDSTWSEWGVYNIIETRTEGESPDARLYERIKGFEMGQLRDYEDAKHELEKHLTNGETSEAMAWLIKMHTINWVVGLLESIDEYDTNEKLAETLKNGYISLAGSECYDRSERMGLLDELERI